jgi:hypothetical protein
MTSAVQARFARSCSRSFTEQRDGEGGYHFQPTSTARSAVNESLVDRSGAGTPRRIVRAHAVRAPLAGRHSSTTRTCRSRTCFPTRRRRSRPPRRAHHLRHRQSHRSRPPRQAHHLRHRRSQRIPDRAGRIALDPKTSLDNARPTTPPLPTRFWQLRGCFCIATPDDFHCHAAH